MVECDRVAVTRQRPIVDCRRHDYSLHLLVCSLSFPSSEFRLDPIKCVPECCIFASIFMTKFGPEVSIVEEKLYGNVVHEQYSDL